MSFLKSWRKNSFFLLLFLLLPMSVTFAQGESFPQDGKDVHEKKFPVGHRGERGDKGHKGNVGPQGLVGATGPKGDGVIPVVIDPTGELSIEYIPSQGTPQDLNNINGSAQFHFEIVTPSGTVLVQPPFVLPRTSSLPITFTIGPPLEKGRYSFKIVNDGWLSGPADTLFKPITTTSFMIITNNRNSQVFEFPFGAQGDCFLLAPWRLIPPSTLVNATMLGDKSEFEYTTNF